MAYDGLFKDWFKQRRKSLDLTQKELAAQVHCSLGTIHGIEQGVQRPSRQLAELLASALQVPHGDREAFVRWARRALSLGTTAHFADDLPAGAVPLASLADVNDDASPVIHSHRIESFTVYSIQDWGEAPAVDSFYGRHAELDQLCEWLVDDRCKLIGVLGMGGIGKTALATYAAAQVQQQFSVVIWRSLRNAPPLAELLGQYIGVLANHAEYQLAAPVEQRLELLFDYLRGQRCLLVLDNFESVLQDEVAGSYLPGFEGYGELVKRLGEGRHQSCLLLTSREKPKELVQLAGTRGPVRELALASLAAADCRTLLQDHGLYGSAEQWSALHSRYSGNPLALQIVSETIRELFDGSIGAFLAQATPFFGGIASLLGQQISRLSPLELDILFWLAVEREPVTVSELLVDLLHTSNHSAVFAAVHTLRQRSLVERVHQGFTLQNVVLEYITTTLVDRISSEINNATAVMLQRYALLKATAKSYVRDSQRNLILGPIAQRLADDPGPSTAENRLASLLAHLRRTYSFQAGYAAGNILNLLVQLGIDLHGHDFSHLAVWQADLRNVEARDVDFHEADLAQSAFTDTFGGARSVAFSPDGNRLAAATTENEIRVWQLSGGAPLLAWKAADPDFASSVAFSHDGKLVATGSGDQSARLWDTDTGICLHTLQGHTGWVPSVNFSPTDDVVASGSGDGTIRLWDTHTGQCLRTLSGHKEDIWSVNISHDGNRIASGSEDRTVRLWDTHTGQCLRTLSGHTSLVSSVYFSPREDVLASGGGDRIIRLWDSHTGHCLNTLRGHTAVVSSVCFSPTGSLLASGSEDRTVRLWDIYTGQCLHTLQGHSGWVRSVCFSPDGNLVASGSYDQTIRLWDTHTGQCLRSLQGHQDAVLSVCYNSNGDILASGGDDQTIRLWDTRTGQCVRTLQGHTAWISSITFGSRENVLASGSGDRTIRLWDTHTGQCLHTLQGHTGWVRSLCFGPTDNLLASGSSDETVVLWDVQKGTSSRILRGDRLYERMNISGARGLTVAQVAALRSLGAQDKPSVQPEDRGTSS